MIGKNHLEGFSESLVVTRISGLYFLMSSALFAAGDFAMYLDEEFSS